MKCRLEDHCIALAGLLQATESVQRVARGLSADPAALDGSLHSLFCVDPESVASVYGGVGGVRRGLLSLRQYLRGKPGPWETEVMRYMVNVLQLERKLRADKSRTRTLCEGIENARRTAEAGLPLDEPVIKEFARLYQQTVSTLSPRIMVQGEAAVLSQPVKADLIRALLLAAIRSAVLWRQCGGRKLYLLLHRRGIARAADRLLQGMQ